MENIMNTNDKYYKNLTTEMFEKGLTDKDWGVRSFKTT